MTRGRGIPQEFWANRHEKKHSSDQLLRLQRFGEKRWKPTVAAPDGKDVSPSQEPPSRQVRTG
jgi:hypothetical protein